MKRKKMTVMGRITKERCSCLFGHIDRMDYVIFDCDGVLLDTEPLYTQAADEVLAEFGKSLPLWLKLRLLGQSGPNVAAMVVRELNLPVGPEEYNRRVKQAELRLFPFCQPIAGAREAVEHWHARHVPMAIATSSQPVSFAVKMSGKEDAFLAPMAAIVTGDQVDRPKPHPDIFELALERIVNGPASREVDRQRCLVVEDSPAGVRAALAADMQVAWLRDSVYDALSTEELYGQDLHDLVDVPVYRSHADILARYSQYHS